MHALKTTLKIEVSCMDAQRMIQLIHLIHSNINISESQRISLLKNVVNTTYYLLTLKYSEGRLWGYQNSVKVHCSHHF